MLGMSPLQYAGARILGLDADALGPKLGYEKNGQYFEVRGDQIDYVLSDNGMDRSSTQVQQSGAYRQAMNAMTVVPEMRSAGLVSNTIGPDFGQPIIQTVTKAATSVGTGHIVLLGLLGYFLLRGRSSE